MEQYMDSKLPPERRAELLLSQMDTREKMAQVNCLFALPGAEDRMREAMKDGIGSVCLLEMRRFKTLKFAAAWQREIQQQIMEQSRHSIPAIFHMEGLCGAFITGATSFPSGIGRGSSFDPELEYSIAEVISRQERAVGVSQILAPVLDVSRDSRMGRQGETYGEDPTLAASMGTAFTKGIQSGATEGRKAESAAKHFLGFHHSQGGIHGADAEIPERLLREIYAKPFQAAITEGGLKGVMPCYCTINGTSVSAGKNILTGLLREEMGFDGVVVSDYSAVENVFKVQHQYESLTEAGLRCMEAGIDAELPRSAGFGPELTQWFEEGKADVSILDQAVRHILTAKFRMGLFENPFAVADERLDSVFYAEKDREITARSARESLVLLKNDGTLPIKKTVKKIAVIGCHAVNPRFFFGGYTHMSMSEALLAAEGSMAGVTTGDGSRDYARVPGTNIQSDETEAFDALLKWQKPGCPNLVEELKAHLPDTEVVWAYGYPVAGEDSSHYEEALRVMADADLILFTLGGKYSSGSMATTGEGVDAANINLPPCQDNLIKRAASLGKPMVGIHLDGRPISSDAADRYLNAILEAWSPAECGGQAITEVLTGEYNPSGRLPVSVARNAGQIPVYYNHPFGSSWHQGESIGFQDYVDLSHKPRYFFGHGLSYTTFSYRDLSISKTEAAPEDEIRISFSIENTGKYAGTEVAQLYLRDRYARMVRPVMELAGFARVDLKPGECGKVTFTVNPAQIAFLDERMDWIVEAGDVDVFVGAASDDLRLAGSFRITDTRRIDGKTRPFWAKKEVEKGSVPAGK